MTHGLRSAQFQAFVQRLARDPVALKTFLQSARPHNTGRVTQRDAIRAAVALLRHRGTPDVPALQAAMRPLTQRSLRRLAQELATQAIKENEDNQIQEWALLSLFRPPIKIGHGPMSPDAAARYDHEVMPLDLNGFIREVPDFPKPGVLFRDVTPLLQNPDAFRFAIAELTRRIEPLGAEAIVGIESRGFLFGAPVAYKLGLPFVPVRKAGKLPADRMSVEFALEYGAGQLDIHTDALARGQSVVIVDDLLATGGTAEATAKLVELVGGRVRAMAFVIDLAALGGRERLKRYEIVTLVSYAGA